MPVHGKKRTTPHLADSTQGHSAPALPDQDEFRQHLRELAGGAIRMVLEDVMREELDPTPHFFSSRSNMAFIYYKSG